VDVEGEDVGAGVGEGGEVVVELLGMLVEGGGDEGAELLSQGDRAGAAEGHREDVGRHFLREEQEEEGRGGWLTAVLLSPIFWIWRDRRQHKIRHPKGIHVTPPNFTLRL